MQVESVTRPLAGGLMPLEVLVVEDNPIYAAWLGGMLEQECGTWHRELHVVTAPTLQDARNHLAQQLVHVVLLDLNLPDSEGLATVAAITELCPQVAVVVVSGMEDETVALKALGKGAQDFVFKGQELQSGIYKTLCRSIERKSVELQLLEAQRSARENERMAAVGVLTGGIAHEYNNLGTIILGNAEMLLREPTLGPALVQRVGHIRDAAQRASDITQGMLSLVRGFTADERPVALTETIHAALHLTEPIARSHGVAVEARLPTEPLVVRGNASVLCQVLVNLVINGCHALVDCERRDLTITLGQSPDGGMAELTVTDTGPGIAPEGLRGIFRPLRSGKVSVDAATGQRGTGLGLALCDAFIRQHHGTIAVESQLGMGTTFRIRLPLVAGSAQTEPASSMPAAPMSLHGRRALVVDDTDEVRDVMVTALDLIGMTVQSAKDSLAAIQLLDSDMPDVVVVDWLMPLGGGDRLIRRIGIMPERQRPGVVVVTGNLHAADRQRLSTFARLSILNKPFSLQALQEAVRRQIGPRTAN